MRLNNAPLLRVFVLLTAIVLGVLVLFPRIPPKLRANRRLTGLGKVANHPGSIKSATSVGSVSLLIPQDQAADAWGCRSFAPMMMSHSMMASSPSITGKTQLETICS